MLAGPIAAVIICLLAAALATVLLVPEMRGIVFYNEQFSAIREEIEKHPNFAIGGQRRHEDLTLEDFGFQIRSGKGSLWLMIRDGTSVRMPDDPVAGITFPAGDPSIRTTRTDLVTDRAGNPVATTVVRGVRRRLRVDSPEWKARGLPVVQTVADVIANFEAIAASLLASPPAEKTDGLDPDFLHLEP